MYLTIDIEGDGLNREYNKQVFPDGNHFDPDTRIWACTICSEKDSRTIVCKLPPVPRRLPMPYYKGGYANWQTNSYHDEATVIPEEYEGYDSVKYKEFLERIHGLLKQANDKGIPVYFKGYGTYEYDKDVLRVNFQKWNLSTDVLDCMKIANPAEWVETHKQTSAGCWVSNQAYMKDGIMHNIEDARQLYGLINSIDS